VIKLFLGIVEGPSLPSLYMAPGCSITFTPLILFRAARQVYSIPAVAWITCNFERTPPQSQRETHTTKMTGNKKRNQIAAESIPFRYATFGLSVRSWQGPSHINRSLKGLVTAGWAKSPSPRSFLVWKEIFRFYLGLNDGEQWNHRGNLRTSIQHLAFQVPY
jgi:hypothetical protein